MSNDYEWLRFVDLDRIATDEEKEKLWRIKPLTNIHIIDRWISRFKTQRLRDVLFSFAVYLDYPKLVRFMVDIGAKKTMPLDCDYGFRSLTNDVDTICLLIDMGIMEFRLIRCEPFFLLSRTAARLGAIVAMGAIRSRLRRERERGGWKDISRIIGRLIWESRKYYSD